MSSDAPADALPIPPDLQPVLARHRAFDWGSVAWDAVRRRAAQVERAEELGKRSRLTFAKARALAEALRGGVPRAPGR